MVERACRYYQSYVGNTYARTCAVCTFGPCINGFKNDPDAQEKLSLLTLDFGPQKEQQSENVNEIPAPTIRCLKAMMVCNITAQEREQMIRSAIFTQRLSGITISTDTAAESFEEAMFAPLPNIGDDE